MHRFSLLGRSLAIAGLLFGVLAAVASTNVGAQGGDVLLTIHVIDCPANAQGNIFDACHDNRLEDVEFEVDGTTVESDDEGVVTTTVGAGEIDVEEFDFDAIATAGKATIFCSPQPGGQPLDEYETEDGTVTLDIDDVEEVHCDWYNRSAPGATILIHALSCPTNAPGNIFDACHDNRLEDVEFDIDGEIVTTDEEGLAEASVTAGSLTIEELDFENLATAGRAFVYCSVQPGGSPVLLEGNTTDSTVTVDVPANATVHCDWYNRTGETEPTAEPTETSEATNTPRATSTSSSGGGSASATATSGTKLPDTGAGPAGGSSSMGFGMGLALVMLAIAGAAYGLRRKPV